MARRRSPQEDELRIDQIGQWSEVKLEIIKEYLRAYSTILSAQRNPSFRHIYIDAFAGLGFHMSKTKQELVPGSPRLALATDPPFCEYHFIDMDEQRVDSLEALAEKQPNVFVHPGDCNKLMLTEVLPKVRYDRFERGLCLLDPYGLQLDWRVIEAAGKSKAIDLFLNFPVMDMNRNVLWNDSTAVDPADCQRMTTFWGDESWRSVAYRSEKTLFGDVTVRNPTKRIVQAFQKRLKEAAQFKWVPEPIPMRNSNDAIVYYLFFASQKAVAGDIITAIFRKHSGR